jgi:hypothetical protein
MTKDFITELIAENAVNEACIAAAESAFKEQKDLMGKIKKLAKQMSIDLKRL